MGAAAARRSAARRGRRVLGPIVLFVAIGTAGCGGHTGSGDATCSNPQDQVVEERPVDVAYRGPVADSSVLPAAPAPRLVIQLTNNQPSVERARLAFDGSEALDIDLPASNGCGSGPPVFSVAYDRPPGPLEVELDTQGSTSTSTIEVPESGTVWAVVDVQSERDWSDLTVYDTKPSWG